MAESIPAQPAAEQSVFDSVAAPVKSMVSESVSETRSSSTSTQTHGIPPPSEVPVTDRPLVVKDMASQATPTEPVNGPTQTVDDTSLPPPVQTSTGEPNGTNGINGAAPVSPDDDEETPLFSQSLISPEVAALLPEGYSMRPLRRSDYHKGFLDVLRVLTTVGEPSFETFSQHFKTMASMPSTYHTLIVLDGTGAIVGTGNVIVERKFIHSMGMVGHIEDIAVAKNQQGKKLGLRIIQALDYVAEKVGCYKCILDCSEANEGFYVKCGFKRAGLEMAHYYGRD